MLRYVSLILQIDENWLIEMQAINIGQVIYTEPRYKVLNCNH